MSLTNEEIIEFNTQIAEFMGYEGQHEDRCGNNILREDSITGEHYMFPFRPHTNWEDLMPCVEKIETLGLVFYIFGNLVSVAGSLNGVNYDWYGGRTGDSKILSIWYGVWAFSKLYNEQNIS